MSDRAKEYQRFIFTLLAPIIPEPKDRVPYLGIEAMTIWVKALTHETVDNNFNYEELELIGDRMLEAVFTRYILRRFPFLKKSEMSEIKFFYMSKLYQAELSKQLGFGSFILGQDIDLNTNMLEDVFESFFGALVEVSDLVEEGRGYLNSYKMIEYLFNPIEIDPTRLHGKSKTQVRQLYFEKLGLGEPYESSYTLADGKVEATVSQNRDSEAFFRSLRLRLPRDLGVAVANTKKEAMERAYAEALSLLMDRGLTVKWAQELKEKMEVENPALADLVGPVKRKLKAEGYEKFRFFTPRSGATAQAMVIQMIGVKPDGENILASMSIEGRQAEDLMAGRRQLLSQYLGK